PPAPPRDPPPSPTRRSSDLGTRAPRRAGQAPLRDDEGGPRCPGVPPLCKRATFARSIRPDGPRRTVTDEWARARRVGGARRSRTDRKSTRLNSSHVSISYAV